MRPFRVVGLVCALGLWAADAGALHAAWNNVFQVCCGHCKRRASYYVAPAPVVASAAPVVANAAPCCPQPCPQTTCTTRYVQRCYYQPVTCYQTKTYYEPVTTYRTSYYYEPVCSYRYSCYYDPCSCSYQQVAIPTTSYQLRSQCCPVQSWVQRCCSVPVTTYQRSFYWEPVTTCCTTQPATPCAQECPPAAAAAPAVSAQAVAPGEPPVANQIPAVPANPPVVDDSRTPARPPAVREDRGNGGRPEYDRYYPPQDTIPPASYRQQPGRPGAVRPAKPLPPPPQVRLDKIVAVERRSLYEGRAVAGDVPRVAYVEGRVVRTDNTPRPNALLRFVSPDGRGPQYPVAANSAGRFRVTLTSGTWLVYINTADGRQVFHSKVEVNGDSNRRIILVSR